MPPCTRLLPLLVTTCRLPPAPATVASYSEVYVHFADAPRRRNGNVGQVVQRNVVGINAVDLVAVLCNTRAIYRNIGRVAPDRIVVGEGSSDTRYERQQLEKVASRKRQLRQAARIERVAQF